MRATGKQILFISGCYIEKLKEQFTDNIKDIDKLKGKHERARKDHIKASYTHRIEFLEEQNLLLNAFQDGDLYKILTTDLLKGEC